MDNLFDSQDMTGLAAQVAQGHVTPAEMLQAALIRTDRVNDKLGAVVLRFDEVARAKIAAGCPPARSMACRSC